MKHNWLCLPTFEVIFCLKASNLEKKLQRKQIYFLFSVFKKLLTYRKIYIKKKIPGKLLRWSRAMKCKIYFCFFSFFSCYLFCNLIFIISSFTGNTTQKKCFLSNIQMMNLIPRPPNRAVIIIQAFQLPLTLGFILLDGRVLDGIRIILMLYFNRFGVQQNKILHTNKELTKYVPNLRF